MAGMRILVVDDEQAVRDSLRRALSLEGFDVELAADGGEALARIAHDPSEPDAVVLDVLMPGVDGLEVCRRLRRDGSRLPILMLTAKDQVEDRVAGLDAGADDYVVKPFALEEVVARLHALLRRRPAGADEVLVAGDLRLDPRTRVARRGERELDLTRREFDLLQLFLRHPGEILDRGRLHEDVWGYTFDPGTNVADVFVGYVRRKLEQDGEPRVLHTVRGVGFVLRP
jgi:DNA-binding response OmpR family regulator